MEPNKRLVSVPIGKDAFAKSDKTTVTWLGAAGFLVNSRGAIILVDPVLSVKPDDENMSEAGMKLKIKLPVKAEDVPKADYVLYTHSDIDHLGPDTAVALSKLGARFIGTYPVYYKLTQLGIDPKSVEVCRIYEKTVLGDIVVEITPADHPWQLKALQRGGRPFRMGECCGYILNTNDGRIFFPGDTRLMEEHLNIREIDLMALDVSVDEFHLGHTAAAVLANNLPGAYLLPLHYGTFDSDKPAHVGEPEDVFALISNGDKRGLLLSPGEPFTLKGFSHS